jgi:DNA-binding FadR family transcriptional regulator
MKNNIMDGIWKPNDKLPSENELSSMFNVSRNTVRSAIQKLRTMGVLISVQGQGTFIRSGGEDTTTDSLLPLLSLSNMEIIDILEFRKAIEVSSVALAAMNRDEDDLEEIQKHLENMKANVENYDEYGAADYEFHLSIAKASKNMIFYSVLVRLQRILYAHFTKMSRELGPRISIDNHVRIFQFIKSKSPLQARATMEENIQQSIDILKGN